MNNISGPGFSGPDEVVYGIGGGTNNIWKRTFATGASVTTINSCPDQLAETGLLLYATESDINGLYLLSVYWYFRAVAGLLLAAI